MCLGCDENLDFSIATGPQGPKGEAGLQGLQGIQGLTGSQGIPGPIGPNGLDGTNGSMIISSNFTGLTGSPGEDWTTLFTYNLPANTIMSSGDYIDIDIKFSDFQRDTHASSSSISLFKLNILGTDLVSSDIQGQPLDRLQQFSVKNEKAGSNVNMYQYSMNIKLFHVPGVANTVRSIVTFNTDENNIYMKTGNEGKPHIKTNRIAKNLALGGEIKFDMQNDLTTIDIITMKLIKH